MRQLCILSNTKLCPHYANEECVFINPSVCNDYIYYRGLNIQSGIWYNKSFVYCKSKDEYVLMKCDIEIEPENMSQGLEDLRLFEFAENVWFVGCMRGNKNRFKTIIGKIQKDTLIIDHTLDDQGIDIKNMVSLINNDKLYLMDIQQLSIFCYDEALGFQKHQEMKNVNMKLSGSTQFVQLSDYIYGGIVHSTYIEHRRYGSYKWPFKAVFHKHRIYQHYWMEIDIRDFKVTFLSPPFYLHLKGIEFVSGIEKLSNTEVCLYYGVNDNSAYKCIVSLNELRKM